MFKNIVFDLDGTLFNTLTLHMDTIKSVYKHIYDQEITSLKILKSSRSTIKLQLRDIFRNRLDQAWELYIRRFNEAIADGMLTDYADIVKVINQIHHAKKWDICLFTGRDIRTTSTILEYFRISSHFKKVYTIESKQEKMCLENMTKVFSKDVDHIYITDSAEEVGIVSDFGISSYLANWYMKGRKIENGLEHPSMIWDILK